MANFHSINGNEIEAHYAGGDLREEIDLKADSDGYYTMLTAGAADNLTARGDGVTASFLYRTTGGSASVPDDAEATVRSIKGRTLGWNQLIKLVSYVSPAFGVTITTDPATGLVSFNGTSTSSGGRNNYIARDIPLVAGHKYLLLDTINYSSGNTVKWTLSDTTTTGYVAEWTGGTIYTANSDHTCWIGKNVAAGEVYDCSGYVSLYDLTAMFGAGNEPATVEEFEALYPLPYYPYDASTLLPVRMTGVETVGFNQWDEQWEVGTYSTANGRKSSTATGIRSTNMVPVMPSTQYHMLVPHTSVVNGFAIVLFYGADGAYLNSYAQVASNGSVFATPSDARYLTFYVSSQYGTTYKGDICVNFQWSGYRNGEYESYWSEQRIIAAIAENFPDGMRSVGTGANMVCDELTETAAIHRVGAVDLGTLTWTEGSNQLGQFFYTTDITDIARPSTSSVVPNLTCAKYETTAPNDLHYGSITVTATGVLYTRDLQGTTYADAVAFKAAMSGVLMFYELATPTTTPFPQPINMDYRFADFGTERILVPDGQMSAPPTMDVVYGLNAPDTLRTLPTEYVSKASDASFTAALGAFLNATITRTWNETAGRYDYTITANGE